MRMLLCSMVSPTITLCFALQGKYHTEFLKTWWSHSEIMLHLIIMLMLVLEFSFPWETNIYSYANNSMLLQLDYCKIYPCLDLPYTKTRQWKQQGLWTPIAEDDFPTFLKILRHACASVPPWVRINRVQVSWTNRRSRRHRRTNWTLTLGKPGWYGTL